MIRGFQKELQKEIEDTETEMTQYMFMYAH